MYGPNLSKYDFKVHWKMDNEPTWETYAKLRDTSALAKYLVAHPLIASSAEESSSQDVRPAARNPQRKVSGKRQLLERGLSQDA